MATGRQWPPSSTSTLSPLAPPFTVDRRPIPQPYDYGYPRGPADGDWGTTIPGDPVQAQPFYHQPGAFGGGDRFRGRERSSDRSPWDGPFDVGGDAKAASSSADNLQGGFSDYFPVENIWYEDNGHPCTRKFSGSDSQGWLQDKTSIQSNGSVSNLVNSSGSVRSPLDLANDSFPLSSSQISNGALNSSSHYYSGSTVQHGYRRGEVGLDFSVMPSHTAQTPESFRSNSLSGKDIKAERSFFWKEDINGNYGHSGRRVSVNIRKPEAKLNVEVGGGLTTSNNQRVNAKTDIAPSSVQKVNSSSGLCREEPQPNLHAKSDLVVACAVGSSSSTEPSSSSQKSETVDECNVAEDSPCWKGAIASRKSPFLFVNNVSASSPTVDKNTEDANGRGLESLNASDSKLNPFPFSFERKKEVSDLDNLNGVYPTPGCNDALLGKREASYFSAHCPSETEIAMHGPMSKSVTLHSSPLHGQCQVLSSSHKDACHTGPPKSFDLAAVSTKSTERHSLFKALCDLSAFCVSYCSNEDAFNGSDHELLLMTRYNIDACLSKRSSMEDKKGSQFGPTQAEVSPMNGKNIESNGIAGEISEMPKSMQLLQFSDSINNYSCLHVPSGGLDFTKDKTVKDFGNRLGEKLEGDEGDPRSNLYKKLWIEAEAAACRLKYELHLTRAKMGLQVSQEKSFQGVALFDPSSIEGKPETEATLIAMTSQSKSDKQNDCQSILNESLTLDYLHRGNDAFGSKTEVVSSLPECREEVDSSVMARFNILMARASNVNSLNIAPPVKLHESASSEHGIGLKHSSLKPSCPSNIDVGMSFLPNPSTLNGVGNPWVHDAVMSDMWNAEAVAGSHDSLMGASPARVHEGFGNRMMIESYVPDNGWPANKFKDVKHGSTSSDWEHVRDEDTTW